MSKSYKNALKLTVCAILSGLTFVSLYLGTLSGVFDLCAVVVGAVCIAFAVIEFGGVWPWMVCAVVTTLSLILLPDKMVAFEYLFLGGAYPILKRVFEGRKKLLSYVFKLIYFNAALTVTLLAAKLLFPGDEAWQIFGPVAYLLGNAFFLFYDYALTTLISAYIFRLRKKLKIKNMR